MNILVTAGNTVVPIDRVRCLTNVFTGRTGARIALHAHERGHHVTLLTSHPETVETLWPGRGMQAERWAVLRYRTFEDLRGHMAAAIRPGGLDAVVHCAAVSDYLAAGVFAPAPTARFDEAEKCWGSVDSTPPRLVDVSAGKVKSDEPELWLRLVRAPKLVDLVRADWGFPGVLVKFKLEVGIGEDQLLAVAERSRRHSAADLMVANTLEGAGWWAYLGPVGEGYQRVARKELAERLLAEVERLHRERGHG